jgi:hypothetical protein
LAPIVRALAINAGDMVHSVGACFNARRETSHACQTVSVPPKERPF